MPIYDFIGKDRVKPADLETAPDFRSDVDKYNPSLSLFNNEAPEIKSARTMADELINLSGAEIVVYPRTENEDFDRVWDEDADPTYLNNFKLKAFYKPPMLQQELKKYGIDLSATLEMTFSFKQLYDKLGERMLRSGDVIYISYNSAEINPGYYKVASASPSGQYRYCWIYYTCNMVILKADSTIRPVDDIIPVPRSGDVGFKESY